MFEEEKWLNDPVSGIDILTVATFISPEFAKTRLVSEYPQKTALYNCNEAQTIRTNAAGQALIDVYPFSLSSTTKKAVDLNIDTGTGTGTTTNN